MEVYVIVAIVALVVGAVIGAAIMYYHRFLASPVMTEAEYEKRLALERLQIIRETEARLIRDAEAKIKEKNDLVYAAIGEIITRCLSKLVPLEFIKRDFVASSERMYLYFRPKNGQNVSRAKSHKEYIDEELEEIGKSLRLKYAMICVIQENQGRSTEND